jgi:hypothetical protein
MTKLDEIADQISNEERTRKAISILMGNKDLATREYLTKIYSDPEIHSIYNGLRADADLDDKLSKGDARKLSIKFPNPTVYKFVDDVMKVKYGEDWLNNRKIFSEDLVIPWIIRKDSK